MFGLGPYSFRKYRRILTSSLSKWRLTCHLSTPLFAAVLTALRIRALYLSIVGGLNGHRLLYSAQANDSLTESQLRYVITLFSSQGQGLADQRDVLGPRDSIDNPHARVLDDFGSYLGAELCAAVGI